MLSVAIKLIMISVVMPSAVMPSVIASKNKLIQIGLS